MNEEQASDGMGHPVDAVPAFEGFTLGPEPEWRVCGCGARSARVPCWECTMAIEARVDRERVIAAAESSIPREFRWAKADAPELPARVDSRRRPLSEVVERILAAHRVVLAGGSGNGKTSLIVAGGSGNGKTSLIVACMRQRLEHGPRFVSAVDLGTARIQHAAGDGEARIVEIAVRAPLLVLDDLGEEQHTATSAVRDVIRARHAAGLPTWVTTGLRSREIVAKYGDGIRRRLFEGAYAEWLGPLPESVKRPS